MHTLRGRWAGVVALLGLVCLAQTGSAQTLDRRLMTWNVGTINPFGLRLPKRREGRVIVRIARLAPDTVTSQELRSITQVGRLQAGLLAQGLDYSVETEANNPSRNDGRLLATFYRNEQVAQRAVFRSTSGYGALALRFSSGWTLVNVHAPAGFHKQRRVYFEELATWLGTLPGYLVLAGDLNLGPRHGAGVASFLPWARKYDRETFRAFSAHFDDQSSVGSTTFYGFHLDHVLVRSGSIVTQRRYKGWGKRPMDHHPVFVETQLAPQPAPTPGVTTVLTGGGSSTP